MTAASKLRVTVLGYGAIGAVVARELSEGSVPGAELVGVISRSPGRASADGLPEVGLAEGLALSDLVVECASVAAVREIGPRIIGAGVSLLPASLGALADRGLRDTLLTRGPGKCYLTAGAIGGLDLLGAASRNGGLDHVSLTSTKRASTLVQPWMSAQEAAALRDTISPISLFDGSVDEAIEKFPASLNVGIALAAATGMWESVRVRLVADPAAQLTQHRIKATGRSGDYEFSITNKPLVQSPTSSGVVPAALLRGLAQITGADPIFV